MSWCYPKTRTVWCKHNPGKTLNAKTNYCTRRMSVPESQYCPCFSGAKTKKSSPVYSLKRKRELEVKQFLFVIMFSVHYLGTKTALQLRQNEPQHCSLTASGVWGAELN